jgi:hypothetical protein
MKNERGIILGPDVNVDVAANTVQIVTTSPNPGLLRHSVLYWDKIDFPQSNVIHIETKEIQELIKAGVAQSTQIIVDVSGPLASLYVASQFAAFYHLNDQNPEMWTMGQHARNFSGINSLISDAQIAELEINDVLPTPPENTPISTILELKNKRKDEFRALRIAVDELYDDVLKSAQMPRAKNAAVNRLQGAITDIRKCVDQSWLDRVKTSVKFDFNLPTLLAQGFAGGVATSVVFPGYEAVGVAAGAVAQCIKFEAKLGSAPAALSGDLKSFAYLYYADKTLGRR